MAIDIDIDVDIAIAIIIAIAIAIIIAIIIGILIGISIDIVDEMAMKGPWLVNDWPRLLNGCSMICQWFVNDGRGGRWKAH